MFPSTGIKASELIKLLQEEIRKHGDRNVCLSGSEFPEGCRGVYLRDKPSDGYYRQGDLVLY